MNNLKLEVKKKEWRCISCNRFLGYILNNNTLEVESDNNLFIITQFIQREAHCKCGAYLTISGSLINLKFDIDK